MFFSLVPHALLRSRLGHAVLVVAVLWTGLGASALAQQTRTLDVRDGTVYVDGQALDNEQLPAGLELEGLNASYQFQGIQRPVVELNGRLVAVSDSGLVPITSESAGRTTAAAAQSGGESQREVPEPSGPDEDARDEASAQEEYIRDVEESSRELYERLQRERQMEQEAQELARVVRMLPEGDAREAKTDSLHSMLNELFEIKQENHRQEIDRLQRKIQELQRRMQKREEMRNTMIDHRLQQLVGESPGQ
ncbi:MAG: hypothetical protein ACLFTE_04200 [Salinivenus sp.]